MMKKYILLSLLFVFHPALEAKELCFNSYHDAAVQAKIWERRGLVLQSRLIQKGKKVGRIEVTQDNCTHCLTLSGDPYLVGVFEEEFENEIKPKIPQPITQEVIEIPVDVSIGGLGPYLKKPNGGKSLNPHYRPFLRFPEKTNNVFYDSEKKPIEVKARIVHPELIEFSFSSGFGKHSQIYRIGEHVTCLFPNQGKDFLRQKFYMQENGKFLPLDSPGIRSYIRDFAAKKL